MFAEQRFAAILEELEQHQAANVSRLCQITGASEATIRRDLTVLADQGLLTKVHGGATLIGQEFEKQEPDIDTKHNLHAAEKLKIARYAASLIQNSDVVFLDAGTTTLPMVSFLKGSGAIFVTNGISCAQQLVIQGLQAYTLGGQLKAGTQAIIGAQAIQSLEQYNFTKAFLGTNGISIRQGFTTPDPEEAAVKAKASHRAYLSFVLADSSKFDKVTTATMFPLEAATIITDHLPNPSYLDHTIIKEV